MGTKPEANRYGSITEISRWQNTREGWAVADAIEAERQRKLPKPKPGGLAGWVLEQLKSSPADDNSDTEHNQ